MPWLPDLAIERAGVVWAIGVVGALPLLLLWLWANGPPIRSATRAGQGARRIGTLITSLQPVR